MKDAVQEANKPLPPEMRIPDFHETPVQQKSPEELVAAGGGRAGVNPDTSLPAFSTDSPVFDAPVSRR
jgi:hypothetical protein